MFVYDVGDSLITKDFQNWLFEVYCPWKDIKNIMGFKKISIVILQWIQSHNTVEGGYNDKVCV